MLGGWGNWGSGAVSKQLGAFWREAGAGPETVAPAY